MIKRYLLVAAVLVAAAIGTGVAVGGNDTPSRTMTPIIGHFDVVRTGAIETICRGVDGVYRDARDTFEGTFTGSDPRLNGHYVGHVNSIFNAVTQFGTDTTDAKVFDASGRVTLSYRAMAIISPGGRANGFADGKVAPVAGLPAGRFRANFSVQLDPSGGQFTLHGELGSGNSGAKLGENTAIIYGGRCIPVSGSGGGGGGDGDGDGD